MRRIRYQVAASLDGYIAGPHGDFDWIVSDPDIDFAAIYSQFDTFLMGRHTYQSIPEGGDPSAEGPRTIVFSRTLRQEDHPRVTIVSDDIEDKVHELRNQPGKDIWLFGGGELFRTLLELGLVDTVEIAIIPVLLGGGIPMLPRSNRRAKLSLRSHRIYKSGIALLEYDVILAGDGRSRTAATRKKRKQEAS